jgi:hypothetical protein
MRVSCYHHYAGCCSKKEAFLVVLTSFWFPGPFSAFPCDLWCGDQLLALDLFSCCSNCCVRGVGCG